MSIINKALFYLFIPFWVFASNDKNPLVEYLGCPENSICSKIQGQKYLEFNKLLSEAAKKKSSLKINEFIKQNGPLISGWVKYTPPELEKASKSEMFRMAAFDSACPAHRPKVLEGEALKVNTYKSEVFYDKILIDDFIPHFAYVQSGEKILRYLMPLKNIPFLIKDQKLIFLMERDSIYYNFTINQNNEASINFDKYPVHEIQSTKCPKNLIEEFKKDKNQSIYEFFNCTSIWNENTKSYVDILYGQSC